MRRARLTEDKDLLQKGAAISFSKVHGQEVASSTTIRGLSDVYPRVKFMSKDLYHVSLVVSVIVKEGVVWTITTV